MRSGWSRRCDQDCEGSDPDLAPKARAAIRHYLKSLKAGEAIELGGKLLASALEEFKVSLKSVPRARLDQVAAGLGLTDAGDLLE